MNSGSWAQFHALVLVQCFVSFSRDTRTVVFRRCMTSLCRKTCIRNIFSGQHEICNFYATFANYSVLVCILIRHYSWNNSSSDLGITKPETGSKATSRTSEVTQYRALRDVCIYTRHGQCCGANPRPPFSKRSRDWFSMILKWSVWSDSFVCSTLGHQSSLLFNPWL